jgi:hypothetical protein
LARTIARWAAKARSAAACSRRAKMASFFIAKVPLDYFNGLFLHCNCGKKSESDQVSLPE